MSTVDNYDIVKELACTAVVQVCRVKTADRSDGSLVVKKCEPPRDGFVDCNAAIRSFLDSACAQQAAAKRANAHWAPVHEIVTDASSAHYLADYYPGSAQKLINGKVRLSAAALLALVRAVLNGLAELHATSGRHHGNLKPTNVLIAATDEIEAEQVFLADPADAGNPCAHDGAADDLFQLGQLIHQLVLHRPFRPVTGWPVETSPAWSRLGHAGKRWRDLCNHLLHPDALARPGGLDEVRKELDRVARRPVTHKLIWAATAAVLVVGLGIGALAYRRSAQITNDVEALRTAYVGWFYDFDNFVAGDRVFRQAAQADPHLAREVLGPLQPDSEQRANLLKGSNIRGMFDSPPSVFDADRARDVRAVLQVIRQVESGLADWPVPADLAKRRQLYQQRGWAGPASYLGQLSESIKPDSEQRVGPGISSLLKNHRDLRQTLDRIEQVWGRTEQRLGEIDKNAAGAAVPKKFVQYVPRAAREFKEPVKDNFGMQRFLRHLEDLDVEADAFAKVVYPGWSQELAPAPLRADEQHFPAAPARRDFIAWGRSLDQYRPYATPPDLIDPLDELAKDIARRVEDIRQTRRAKPEELKTLEDGLAALRLQVEGLRTQPRIRKEQQAAVARSRELDGALRQYQVQVANAMSRLVPEKAADWLREARRQFDADDAAVNEAWQERLTKLVGNREAQLDRDVPAYIRVRDEAAAWAALLRAIPPRFPPPQGMAEPFASAVVQRRQAALKEAVGLVRSTDTPVVDEAKLADVQARYEAWLQKARAVAANVDAARDILQGGGMDAGTTAGLSVTEIERLLQPDAELPREVNDAVAAVLKQIADRKTLDARVKALAGEAEALRAQDNLAGAREKYNELLALNPRDRDAAARRDALAAEIQQRIEGLLVEARRQAAASELQEALATLAEVDKWSPKLPAAVELREKVRADLLENEQRQGFIAVAQQAQALLEEGSPDDALSLLKDLQGSEAERLRARISRLKRNAPQTAYAADQNFASGEYAHAAGLYRESAEGGLPWSMYRLGVMLRDGKGVAQDPALGSLWIDRAALRGNTSAMRTLVAAEGARGGQKWLSQIKQAAAAGDLEASVNLAEMYALGEGVQQSDQRAVQHYQKAASENDVVAILKLASMYEAGRPRPNPNMVKQLYEKAADLGSREAKQWLAKNRQSTRRRPPRDLIDSTQ